MEFKTFVFYVFAALAIFAALRVVTARNPVHAVLFLVLTFFNVAGLWLLLNAEFLAIALVMVYVGAVMVLFLFVVMMLDVDAANLREGFWKHFPLAGFIGALIALEMAVVLMGGFRLTEAQPLDATQLALGNSKLLGIEIYTLYLYPLQVAAVLLLVAIIAAIALTLRRRKDSRQIDVSRQLAARKADRLRVVKMPPVVELPSSARSEGRPS
jgi:NADH-quinone oxidoreductase subunit J